MGAANVPGLSIARIQNSRVVWSRQFGRRAAMDETVTATLIDAETVFEAASLGKPLVAIAALWLLDRSRLDLDESADAILPYSKLDDPRKTLITPRMLMSHTSGLAFIQPKLDADPGSRYSYSTEGFRYLQRIVEQRLDESLERWAQKTLFGPLKMERTSFVFAERFDGNRATGRNWLDRGQEYMTNAAGTGAFDLITTADDYAKLWAGVLRGEVLSPKSLRLMFKPQKPITSAANDPLVPKTEAVELAAGLGLLLQKQRGRWVGFQWGDNGGSTGFLIVDSERRDAVVFLSNAQDGLHAGQAIVAAARMTDQAIGWIGYNAFDTPARVAWKQITRKLNVDREGGLAEYKRLLKAHKATVVPLSRNLGYYNKFRGFVAEAEPFFRVAVEQNSGDADLYEVWAESLQASGQVEAASKARQRAKDLKAIGTDGKLP
ncbi:MAG: beta-lactamase family protein [Acidobacteria bacterium]|nr:beta-lactamase family protein [Acidobacteriota bacterium]